MRQDETKSGRSPMRNRVAVAMAGVVAAGALVFASAATAATEFGNNCVANGAAAPKTAILQIAKAPSSPLPLAAPSAGVMTQWKVNLIPEASIAIQQQLKVFRPTGGPKQFLVVGESTPGYVFRGANSFETRIPVAAGDLIGLFGTSVAPEIGPLYCKTASTADKILAFATNPLAGSTVTAVGEASEVQGAVSAVIEPDADGDGYGDETQDKCPQSAALQNTACPAITLEAFSLVGGNSVSVLVATSSDAPVKVTGTVKLGKAGKAKLSAKTKTVKAGKIASFKLKFSVKLKQALKELGPDQKLNLKLVASATNVAGKVSKDKLTAKLKG
jgi:hypothetical protein